MDDRQTEELQLWRDWKSSVSGGQPRAVTDPKLEVLLKSLQPMITRKVNEFRGAPVPPMAIEGFATQQVVKALHTFDPSKAQLNTFLSFHLKKTQSFVGKHQNVAKIPAERINLITDYRTAKADLEQEMGHEPDALSIAERMGISTRQVGHLEHELSRKAHIASLSLEADTMPEMYSRKEREALRYIHHDLTPDERLVFEYTIGLYGKPPLKAGQIATRMGISNSKVSRLRTKIDEKLKLWGV